MRLATIATPHGPRAAAFLTDRYVDLHGTDRALPACMTALLAGWPEYRPAVEAAVERPDAASHAAEQVTLRPPVPNPRKIICIGLNYRDHAIEGGKAIPSEPVLFSKFPTALIAAHEPIVLPRVAKKVDYEAELVIVIGRRGRHIPNDDSAFNFVAGYTCGHDVSARDWQFRGEEKQWTIGKTFDTFAPVGPHILTRDEPFDPHQAPVKLRLNGQLMQNSNTREFIFKIPFLLHYLSQVFTLEPGDLIYTGTPPGVGIARKPPVLLKPGDVVEVEIEGLGVLKNPVIAEE